MTIQEKKIRIRRNIKALNTTKLPRLCVIRSNQHMYAQIIDSNNGNVLAQFSTLNLDFRNTKQKSYNIEAAKYVGEIIGQKAKALGITQVVFDRSGYIYHGKVKALADGARTSIKI